jgi:hypothetical protein
VNEEETMRKNKIFLIALGVTFILSTNLALADEEDTLKWKGNFEFGYRYVDVSGNIDKYYEDLNIRTGPRLLSLNFDILPSGKYKKYFDLFNLYASTLGGDPFESYGFTLKKYGHFNLRYGHRKSTYYYHDIILPHDQASIEESSGGDFHTYNFQRVFDDLYFDIRLLENAKFFVAFDRQQRIGESTTTLDLERDEFEFDQPLDELKTEYRGGVQVNLDKVDFYLEGSYRDYENHSRMFLPGFSLGENPEGPTTLAFFELMTPYEFTMPMFTARVNARPTNRIKATVAYVFSDLAMELDYDEKALGVSYTGQALDYETTGQAEISRKFNLFDIDLSFQALDKVNLIGGFRYHKLDQEGELTVDSEIENTIVDIKTSIFEFGAQVLPYRTLSVTGGLRLESRDALYEIESAGPEESKETKRTTFFFNANYSLSQKFNLKAEYERGSFQDPYSLMSPTDLNRFKVRAKVRPMAGLYLLFTYLRRDLDNDDTGGKFDSNTLSLDASYNVKDKLYVSAGYSRQASETSILNIIPFNPPFPPFFFESTWDILYESGNNIFRGSLKYMFSKNIAAGIMAYYYTNSGTWELDWTKLKGWLKYSLNSGYHLLLSFQYNDYNEDKYNFDDYSSNIFTVGFGYKF